ncbi:hypothetical protein JTE90_003111 [Oedothorax gibbosus]|uniref:Ubiquitinyl hydrolase 1 n=1 Tax=Oedothorax gibbosus TaxID=931172 RepID=A0AAV6VF66_9ARAC|nr:hypothetical protein JTE90_003111 [Oedothorax gibbosus]
MQWVYAVPWLFCWVKAIHDSMSLYLPTLKKKTCDVLMRRAMKLHADTEVAEGGLAALRIFEFLNVFLDVQVIVISSKELQKISYKGSERPQKVYLWLHKGHYDLITSLKGFYGRLVMSTVVDWSKSAINLDITSKLSRSSYSSV